MLLLSVKLKDDSIFSESTHCMALYVRLS